MSGTNDSSYPINGLVASGIFARYEEITNVDLAIKTRNLENQILKTRKELWATGY